MTSRCANLHLTGHLEVSTELGAFLGDRRVRLLEAIASHGSIAQAARHVPLSYKAAWDAVDAMNNLSDRPLVERLRGGRDGGGTVLTEHGRRVVALYRAVEAEYQLALDRLAERYASEPVGDVQSFQRLIRRLSVRSSARNQFVGTIASLRAGDVDVEVRVRVDDDLDIAAQVTRESVELLALAEGRQVLVLVKASSLMLFAGEQVRVGALNRLDGIVARIVDGPVNSQFTLDIGGGRSAVAVVARDSVEPLGLQVGDRALAAFKAASVILATVD